MFRRANRQHANELRELFIANRARARAWVTNWDCPEIAWPAVPAVPTSWSVIEGHEEAWLKRHAPFMDQYHWFLEAEPLEQGITHVRGNWWFGRGHEFERLEFRTRTVADPPYLAEMLSLGVNAAGLKGWSAADTQFVHEWLLDGLDSRPMSNGVKGRNRIGFVLLDFFRTPHSRTEINVQLDVTLTDAALDGSPLDGSGEPAPH